MGNVGLQKWMRKRNYIINQPGNANREGLAAIWNLAACLHQRLLTFLLDSSLSLEASRAMEKKKKTIKNAEMSWCNLLTLNVVEVLLLVYLLHRHNKQHIVKKQKTCFLQCLWHSYKYKMYKETFSKEIWKNTLVYLFFHVIGIYGQS